MNSFRSVCDGRTFDCPEIKISSAHAIKLNILDRVICLSFGRSEANTQMINKFIAILFLVPIPRRKNNTIALILINLDKSYCHCNQSR